MQGQSTSSSSSSARVINEKSPLIPRQGAGLDAEQQQKQQRAVKLPTLAPHMEVPEILIDVDAAELPDFAAAGQAFYAGRPSCESGFNDLDLGHITDTSTDEEDQVWLALTGQSQLMIRLELMNIRIGLVMYCLCLEILLSNCHYISLDCQP